MSEKQALAAVMFEFSETEPVTFRADASEFWELSQSRRLASEFELTRKLHTGRWSWLVEELETGPTIAECVVDSFREWPELWKLWIRSIGQELVWAEAVQERPATTVFQTPCSTTCGRHQDHGWLAFK